MLIQKVQERIHEIDSQSRLFHKTCCDARELYRRCHRHAVRIDLDGCLRDVLVIERYDRQNPPRLLFQMVVLQPLEISEELVFSHVLSKEMLDRIADNPENLLRAPWWRFTVDVREGSVTWELLTTLGISEEDEKYRPTAKKLAEGREAVDKLLWFLDQVVIVKVEE